MSFLNCRAPPCGIAKAASCNTKCSVLAGHFACRTPVLQEDSRDLTKGISGASSDPQSGTLRELRRRPFVNTVGSHGVPPCGSLPDLPRLGGAFFESGAHRARGTGQPLASGPERLRGVEFLSDLYRARRLSRGFWSAIAAQQVQPGQRDLLRAGAPDMAIVVAVVSVE